LVTERTQVRTAHLVGNLNPFNQQYNQLVDRQAHTMQSQGFSPGEVHQRAVGLVYTTLQTQASVLAYMDVFALCAILAFCVVPLTLLFKTPKISGAPAAR
jgi:MFS transporter, DHA2 family, multidrug resistance protein